MKMVNRAVHRWEGGRAKNPGRRPNRMENGESRGSAMGGGRAQTGRGNTLDIWHFVTKMYKNKKEQRQIHFFGAARQKSLLCYQKLVQGRGLRRRPAGGPGAAAEGCGASVLYGISWRKMFTRSLCGIPETGRRRPEILRLAAFLYGKHNENGESRGSPMGGGGRNLGRRPTEWKMVNRAVQRWEGGGRKPVEAIHWIYAILLQK